MADSAEKTNLLPRDFSKVILSLENVSIPDEKLSATSSLLDGLDKDTEWDLRILGCELIQTSGILLKLPQVAMATGQVLFQRFYFSKSFVKHNMEIVAMSCIYLAAKIEEAPRRIRDVINVFHHIKQVKSGKTISPLVLDQNYINLKTQVIKAERRVLKELGFCVHVQHPHKMIVMFLQVLECEQNQTLVQCAWNYMNDSFRSVVFVKYQPETIACACIFLAARQLQIPLPNNPPWYGIFNVGYQEIEDISMNILGLYVRPKPNVEQLEKTVNDAKKLIVEAKLKAKGLASEGATPNSRPVSPGDKASPAGSLLGLPVIKKLREDGHASDSSQGGYHNSRHNATDKGRKRSRSRSHSKSRSAHSSSGRSASGSPRVRGDRKKHRKGHDYYRNSSKDKYGHDRHSSDPKYITDKYSDRYYSQGSDKHDKYSSHKYDPKYDAYNYREKDMTRDYIKEHKHSGSKHRDVSYSPKEYSRSPSRSTSHKKSSYKEKHRSRSPVDRGRSSKKHNGRSKDRYSSRR